MKGFSNNIEQATLENSDFRRVLYTGRNTQLVLMSLPAGTEIGLETHTDNDQFFRFEAGQGRVVIDDSTYEVGNGSAVIVPAGAKHNVINTSRNHELKMYTLYSPPHHLDGIVRKTRQEAESDDEEYDGVPSE